MMPAVKHLDPVLGVDIHFIITPPGPVVPIPHPHIGIVFDPFDYLPIIGATVVVNGLPRAQAGTGGRTLPPHFPIGGVFARPPGNENETFMGSSTVVVEDEPFTYMLLPVLSCQDIGMPSPPRKKGPGAKTLLLPTSIALSIPAGAPVIVGGPPTISMSGLLGKVAMTGLLKGLKKLRKLQKASRRMKALSHRLNRKATRALDKLKVSKESRLRDFARGAICTLTGHPVDVATGKVVTEATDWELPGPIPLRFTRRYASSWGGRDSALGWGWSHSLEMAVWEEDGRVVYRAEDGREIEFDTTGFPKQRLPVGAEAEERTNRLTLRRVGEQRWEVESAEGLTHELRGIPGEPWAGLCRVVRTRNRAGHSVEYEYDGRGHLRWVRDSAGRRVLFECDAAGHLLRVALPHPREPGQVTHNRYVYSEAGHLLEVQDALGHAMRYAYEGALLVRETDRTGLSFHFEYDGQGPDAWCVRTWGDGGIFNHRLRYDRQARVTEVTDSLGHTTTYESDGRGVVVREVDALGGEKRKEYDEALRLVSETDALGHTTAYEYDARGNRSKVVGPDGVSVEVRYNAHNLPEEATDANGGTWRWRYDVCGQLLEEVRPTGEQTRMEYKRGLLSAVTDECGARLEVERDEQGNVSRLREGLKENGREERVVRAWYDRRGQLVQVRTPQGGLVKASYDLEGRLGRVEDPDGTSQELKYDDEGNVVEVCWGTRHVRYGYTGYHWLAWQQEAGRRVQVEYDTEGQVIGLRNEMGEAWRWVLDACGRTREDTDFSGRTRRYERNLAGEVTRVVHPDDGTSDMAYDEQGQLVEVRYSDGGYTRYTWGPGGLLAGAENEHGRLELERDAVGRVRAERHGEHRVVSRYAKGQRVEVRSSLNARQSFSWSPWSQLYQLALGPEEAGWEERYIRNVSGLELSRHLPGSLQVLWEREGLGAPRVRSTRGTHEMEDVTYSWRTCGQLASVRESSRGETCYFHDEVDALQRMSLPDGGVQERTPGPPKGVRYLQDAAGRRTEKHCPDGSVWRYRWSVAGLLREVERPDGRLVRFEYDALTRRTRKWLVRQTADGGEHVETDTRYVWDGDVLLHEVSSNGGVTTWHFDPDSFTPLVQEREGRYRAIVCDHLGTPTDLYDEQGRQVGRLRLDILGGVLQEVGDFDCPWRWPGQYADKETGLYYNRFRYYDPEAGLYIQPDPLGPGGGLDVYAYVADPTLETDPLGLASQPPCLRREARRTLQQLTRRANRDLLRDMRHNGGQMLQSLLSNREYGFGRRRTWGARVMYGTAVERRVAEMIDADPRLSSLFKHTSRPGAPKPDFEGLGRYQGMKFDITTNTIRSIRIHMGRRYGSELLQIFYSRPGWFSTFP